MGALSQWEHQAHAVKMLEAAVVGRLPQPDGWAFVPLI